MTMPSYGPSHRGRVVRPGPLPDTYEVEVAALAEGQTMGPYEAAVSGLVADDRVLLTQIGTSQSDLIIVGKLPPIPLDSILPIDLADVTGLGTALAGKQPTDGDLTDIAALAPAANDVIQRVGGVWTNRTMAQLLTALAAQPLDGDLTDIAALAPAANDVIQRVGGVWTNRTMAQLLTALAAQPLDTDLSTIAGLSPAASDVLQYIAGAWANRTMAQLKTSLAVAIADVAGLSAALALLAPLADPTFTGTLRVPRIVNPVAALTDAATIATDAALGNNFRVTLGGNRTLGSPTNPNNGQRITWEFIQDATGSRTLTLVSTFGLGTDVPAVVLSTTAGRRDYLTAIYNSTVPRWSVIDFKRGYS